MDIPISRKRVEVPHAMPCQAMPSHAMPCQNSRSTAPAAVMLEVRWPGQLAIDQSAKIGAKSAKIGAKVDKIGAKIGANVLHASETCHALKHPSKDL